MCAISVPMAHVRMSDNDLHLAPVQGRALWVAVQWELSNIGRPFCPSLTDIGAPVTGGHPEIRASRSIRTLFLGPEHLWILLYCYGKGNGLLLTQRYTANNAKM